MSWCRPASPASESSPMGQWGRRLCSRYSYMKTYGVTHEQLALVSVELKNPARSSWITNFGYYGLPGLDTMRGGKGGARAAEILGSSRVAAGFEPSVPVRERPSFQNHSSMAAREACVHNEFVIGATTRCLMRRGLNRETAPMRPLRRASHQKTVGNKGRPHLAWRRERTGRCREKAARRLQVPPPRRSNTLSPDNDPTSHQIAQVS
jgi:hypothetical protein